MKPTFLVPETIVREDGHAEPMSVEAGTLLLLTLGITRILEQESLDVVIQGSADGEQWQPLIAFPQKFYCGTYALLLDLARTPEIVKLKVHWKLGRWGRGDQKPLFGWYLFAEDARIQTASVA